MDPQPSSSRRPVFATRSPPGYHSGGMPKFQAHVVAAPPHCRNSIQDAHPKKTERKNGLRRIKGLDVIQIASTNPVLRCRLLESRMVLEEITFWTSVCNMWLLENNKQQESGLQRGRGEGMMDSNSLVLYYSSSLGQQEYPHYNGNPSHGYKGGVATTIDPARNHHSPTTTFLPNGVEAIRAALYYHGYEDSMPISVAAAPQPHHSAMQSSTRRAPNNDYFATMPRRRNWREQVPRPAGLQTREEREFNGVDVYGRYKPDA